MVIPKLFSNTIGPPSRNRPSCSSKIWLFKRYGKEWPWHRTAFDQLSVYALAPDTLGLHLQTLRLNSLANDSSALAPPRETEAGETDAEKREGGGLGDADA